AGAPAAPPVSAEEPPATPVASAPAPPAPAPSASVAPSSSARCGDKEFLDAHGNCSVCPPGQVLGSDGNCKAPAPCIDGEDMMGACICPHGKSVDDTGHCVAARCPEGTTGGTVFRNETTGDCMECHPGTVPCGDHCCPGGAKRSH
ncbi:MAG TPA: hypothetical protein VIF09_07595, partial [Polyangiaceae bacterium]